MHGTKTVDLHEDGKNLWTCPHLDGTVSLVIPSARRGSDNVVLLGTPAEINAFLDAARAKLAEKPEEVKADA